MPIKNTQHSSGFFRIDRKLVVFSFLFLVSGSAGLIYEIIWERLLGLYFGVTMVSVALIVAAYMGGLGLGSLIGGHLARRLKSTLLIYGLLEVSIGLFGLVSLQLINAIGRLTAGSPSILVFVFSFALLLIPTFLMGMTLPLLSQAFIDRVEHSGQVIGLLYGINTIGAAFGALIAAYLLIGWLGFDGSIHTAVGMNLFVGGCALVLSRGRTGTGSRVEPASPQASSQVKWSYRIVLIASFLVGFIGLGYEMLWIRILGIINKSTAYSFPTILGVFLLGLALGGYIWGKKADQAKDPVGLFVKIELSIAIVSALTFFILWKVINLEFIQEWLERVIQEIQRPTAPYLVLGDSLIFSKRVLVLGLGEYLLPIFLLVFPTALLMGGGLPVLDRIAIDSPKVAGRKVGDIHLANILGSVAGTLATSFLLFPLIGSELTYKTLALMSLSFPLLAIIKKSRRDPKARPGRTINVLIVTVVCLAIILPGRMQFYQSLFTAGTNLRTEIHESGDGLLAVSINDEQKSGYFWIGGVVNGFYPLTTVYERRTILCAGASQPEKILVIGLGGGAALYFLDQLPEAEEIVVVELQEDLSSFIQEFFPYGVDALGDPRIRYVTDDARRYLNAHPGETFDLISIDPLQKFTVGHNNLYSTEAMQLYLAHLTENGVLCEWRDELHVIAATTASVFPYVDDFLDVTIAGKNEISYDLPYLKRIAETYMNTAEPYMSPGFTLNPEELLHTYVRDRTQILAEEQGVPILTDSTPWLEYYLFLKPIVHEHERYPLDAWEGFLRRIESCDQECRDSIEHWKPSEAE